MSNISFSQLGKAGRLANQLFQITGVMAYAAKYNVQSIFPEWEYQKYFKYNFNSQPNIVVDRTYNEPTFHYTPIPYLPYDFDYNGYLQSPKYWEGIIIPHKLFELKPEYQKQVDDLYQQINPKGFHTIAIHVRRGDYLKPPHDEYHGVLEMNYYESAIVELVGHLDRDFINSKIMFLWFSDDIDFCKKNAKGIFANKFFVEGNTDIIDLFLMAKCNDNIIANSSFSYWGYLLNQNPDKRCIAPKNWFKNAPLDTKDLYLPEMILI